MKKQIALLTIAVALAGCGANEETALFNGPEIRGALTKQQAQSLAHGTRSDLLRLGYSADDVTIYPSTGTGNRNSMGQAISNTAYLVCVRDWDNTPVGATVVWWYRGTVQATTPNGKPYERPDGQRHYVIHQVAARTDSAMRTRGMNNSKPDGETVFRDNYVGTLVNQIYYTEGTNE